MARYERVYTLLDALRSGVDSAQLARRLERNQRYGQITLKRGRESENRVKEAVKSHPLVESVQKSITGDTIDRRGIDLIAHLRSKRHNLPLSRVNIQVKSSDSAIEAFFQKVASVQDISLAEVSNWLLRNRLIVLNGQKDLSYIREHFDRQLQAILAAKLSR